MARLATALALLATAAAFDYAVEVDTPNAFATGFPSSSDTSLAVTRDGLLYASEDDDSVIWVYTVDGEYLRTIELDTEDSYLPGIVINDAGTRLYYAEEYCIGVVELDNDDVYYTIAGDCTGETDQRDGIGSMAGISGMYDINPLALDEGDMNIYFIDYYCAVRKLHIHEAEITTIAGGFPTDDDYCDGPRDDYHGRDARFYDLYSISVHGTSIYVADYETISVIDTFYPHTTTMILGDRNMNYESALNDGANVGGRGLDARFGSYLGITVDNFGEWLFVTDYDWGILYQCALDNVVECVVIAGVWDEYEEIDGVGTNARFECIQGIVQGKGMYHHYLFVGEYCSGNIRRIQFNDLRDVDNDSPKFTIGVFVAGGVAALLAGFVVLNSAPVA